MSTFSLLTQLNFKHIYFRGNAFDRRSLLAAIDHLSGYLVAHNRSSSPFILLAAYNHIKSLIAYYAILKAGKIPALMDPGCKSMELAEIIEDIDPAAILFLNSSEISFHYEEEIVFRNANPGFIISSDLKDVCTLAYTNAEDGYSKGAMLTEKNLLSEIQVTIQTNKLDHNSVTCALLPFSHLFGLVQGMLVPTHAGGSGLISELDLLKINDLVTELHRHRVSHIYTVPSLYYLFCKVPGIELLLKNVKEFYSGGTQLTSFVFNTFREKTGRKIREAYGLTETSPGVSLNYDEEGPVVGSIGKALPGCEIRILNSDGSECAPEQVGEICVRGNMVFKGYFNHEQTTREVLRNGWLWTGDWGKMDSKGNYYFCGLKKNMINVAGNNVYPKKLERMIRINKTVRNVSIFSEESVLQGQIVGASIQLHNPSEKAAEELKRWCFENINKIILPKIWVFE